MARTNGRASYWRRVQKLSTPQAKDVAVPSRNDGSPPPHLPDVNQSGRKVASPKKSYREVQIEKTKPFSLNPTPSSPSCPAKDSEAVSLKSCTDKDTLEAMESQQWAWLMEWFVEINPWSENFSSSYRVTWISCFGVPIHGWNYDTFSNIANIWGVLISLDAKALELKDFSKGSLRIMTNLFERIDEIIEVHCGSTVFPVRVTEIGDEWISLLHCCCKPSKPPTSTAQEQSSDSATQSKEEGVQLDGAHEDG
ncbi:hypothetical protein REPUB_Repub20aG0010400 [Reevesia pubescens]